MKKCFALSAVMLLILSGTAFAQAGGCTASVNHISGSLLVNQGNGFRPLTHNIVLHPGDIVMASGDGSGVVDFSDGTAAKVVQGHAVRIPGSLPCGGVHEGGETANGFAPGYVFLGGAAFIALGLSNAGHSSPVSP